MTEDVVSLTPVAWIGVVPLVIHSRDLLAIELSVRSWRAVSRTRDEELRVGARSVPLRGVHEERVLVLGFDHQPFALGAEALTLRLGVGVGDPHAMLPVPVSDEVHFAAEGLVPVRRRAFGGRQCGPVCIEREKKKHRVGYSNSYDRLRQITTNYRKWTQVNVSERASNVHLCDH